MKLVRGRAEARFLPSRHHFALFRLAAFVRMRKAKPEPRDVVMILDRDQNAIDHYATSLWIVLTLTCYLASTLFAFLPLPAGLVVSLPVAAAASHLPYFITALGIAPIMARGESHIRVNSVAMMSILLLLAAYFVRSTSWVRFAGWQFLAIAALNGIAALIELPLRDSIARQENSIIGGAVSER
jgi:hypothetical protein